MEKKTAHFRRPMRGPGSGNAAFGKSARAFQVGIPQDLAESLDRWIATQPDPLHRPDAVRFALRDWLIGQGVTRFSESDEGKH